MAYYWKHSHLVAECRHCADSSCWGIGPAGLHLSSRPRLAHMWSRGGGGHMTVQIRFQVLCVLHTVRAVRSGSRRRGWNQSPCVDADQKLPSCSRLARLDNSNKSDQGLFVLYLWSLVCLQGRCINFTRAQSHWNTKILTFHVFIF